MPKSGSGVLGSRLKGGGGRTFQVIWKDAEMGGTTMALELRALWQGYNNTGGRRPRVGMRKEE